VAQERNADPLQLWFLPYPSGEARKLTNDLSDYGRITVTADSRLIAAQQITRISHLWLLPDGNDSKARQITSGMTNNGHSGLTLSPEGRLIFVSNRSSEHDIWAMDADGNNANQITAKTGGRNSAVVSSPDGRYLIFTSNRSGQPNVWRTDADGNNSLALTAAGGSAPSVSPDSRWVYYVNFLEWPTVIERVSIDGGAPIRVTTGKYAAGHPVVSPNGKLLAHTFYDEEKGYHVAVMPADGGDPIRLFDHAAQHILRWTPDSKALVFIKPITGNMPGPNLWRQPVNGGSPEQLTHFGPKEDPITNFAISSDGKQIIIARGRLYSDVVLLSDFR
jgi:Tol biopolymer transport system component